MAQEQVQLEFPQEFQMMPQLQQAAAQNPQAKQQLTQISQVIEARKAVLIADMTEEFMKEEKAITTQFDHDPLLKLKEREVDLKAREEERKVKEDEARLALDRLKMMQAKTMQDEKLDQNEELAKLRADTTMDKAMLSTGTKIYGDKMKAKDVNTLKGPKR